MRPTGCLTPALLTYHSAAADVVLSSLVVVINRMMMMSCENESGSFF